MKSNHNSRLPAVYISAIVLFVFISNAAFASHNAGGQLTYTHLSGNVYRMHAVYFRDCFGIPAPGSITLTAQSTSCNLNQSIVLLPIQGTGTEINMPCLGVQTWCTGGTSPGMQKWEYEADIALQGQCPDWVFYFMECCRNQAITTIQTPGSEDLYVEAHLNNLNADNNSPQFTNDPIIFSCTHQDFHYNNGMFDPDGDSLVYHLICPMSAQNTCVNYFPPHSAQQPLLSTPPVTFDYFTGDYIMNPDAQEVGIIAYEIFDYRNGELMGSVMRDIIVYTLPCADQNPTATEMNGTSQQIDYVFPTDTICFDIFSDDPDATDSLTMTWNQVIPAATFTTTAGLHPTGTFCWTPSVNDVRSQPYMFTATIRDDNCPMNSAGVYSYFIYVTYDSSLVLSGGGPGENSSISVHPNPSTGIFEIISSEKFSEILIYNHLGECILINRNEYAFNLSLQPPGIYFVEAISIDGSRWVKKIVKE